MIFGDVGSQVNAQTGQSEALTQPGERVR